MHESMWLNMGLWRGAHTFVGACEDLADLVARAARVGPGSRVFEAGSGCGDSSFHILTAFRARSVFAVTLEPVQHYVAVNRSRKLGLEAGTNFLFGDAADPNDWTPTPIEAWENTFDAAISVDAAYHFETRQKFLQLVFDRILRPGGRFAAADIVAGPGFRDYLGDGTAGHPVFRDALQYAFRAAHLPYENLWDGPREYEERLRRIGFAEVRAEDISEDVFPGFVRFLDRFAEAWSPSGFEERLEVLYFAAVRELIRFLHQKRVLAFVLVSGRKPVEAA
ncbi:S-adenosyl-L-methionine-dependent methyltransferase [Hyaloraphidium curvatum]|nr:S-adenosyl-L-methionine-dependent methyltransferase [Hyaloraphidium curvatum]